MLGYALLPLSVLTTFTARAFPGDGRTTGGVITVFLFFVGGSFLFVILCFVIF